MKFFSFLKFDIRHGIFSRDLYKKLLIWIIFFLLGCLEFYSILASFEYADHSLGDNFLYIFGGMEEYVPDPSNPFRIPYLWLINHILLLYFTLHYMHDDLTGYGQHTIYRSGRRGYWWISKCFWNIGMIIFFYLSAWVIILIISCFFDARLSFNISPYMSSLMNFGSKQIVTSSWELTIEITLLPLLVTLTLSLFQMVLCLIIKPIFSYIISVIILVSSAYYLSPMLVGNYAMALRSDKVVTNGLNTLSGILYSAFFIIACIVTGSIIFSKCNILNKEIE